MGLFSGLDKLGIKDIDKDEIIQKKKAISENGNAPAPVEKKEEDMIFDRHYKCPVCDITFTARSVKASGLKSIGKDTDLRPKYDLFDPLKYDAICCDKCGYSAISKYFKTVTSKQAKAIKERVGTNFSGLDNNLPKYSYDDAILRHKLALVCCIVKNARNSERAYTSLKLAWMLRGKRETLDIKNENEVPQIKELCADELECLNNAYEGFTIAMSSENYPIAGMDEITLKYIMADLARKLKKYDAALKLTGDIIVSKGASDRIKEEARKEKELIKNAMKSV